MQLYHGIWALIIDTDWALWISWKELRNYNAQIKYWFSKATIIKYQRLGGLKIRYFLIMLKPKSPWWKRGMFLLRLHSLIYSWLSFSWGLPFITALISSSCKDTSQIGLGNIIHPGFSFVISLTSQSSNTVILAYLKLGFNMWICGGGAIQNTLT